MIPQLVLDALPATIGEIAEFAPLAGKLRSAYKAFTNPLDFVNAVLRQQKGLTRAEAGLVYRVAKYFGTQSRFLSMFGADEAIDRRLAGVSSIPAEQYDPTRPYRYQVDVDARNPKTGQLKTWSIYVPSEVLLDPSEIKSRAVLSLVARFESAYAVHVGSDQEDDWLGTASIINFTRFTRGA